MKGTLITWFSISTITIIFAICYDIKKRGFKHALKHICHYYPQVIMFLCLGPVTFLMFIHSYIQTKLK